MDGWMDGGGGGGECAVVIQKYIPTACVWVVVVSAML